MKLKQTSYRNWLYTLLSFLVPFVTMTMVLLVNGYAPFGKDTLLYSDMYHQYFPFFKEFRRVLLSGESLIYNWSVGLGLDYLGLISYYLASPLYLLGVLVPDSAVLNYFSMLMPIKLGLAGMFFSIFLQKIFQKQDLSIPVFSAFYATCAWALGYQWNIMWLDTFALLPLVMVGMVSLLRDKKFILYTITLFLSVGINYYIGFFTCIFILLTFFCYEICRGQSGKRFLQDFVRIAVFSVIAIGMTAFLTLPAIAALQTTQSSVNSFPTEFRLNMGNYWNQSIWGLLDSMSQVAGNMNGGYEPTYKEGLPNIYCGVFATVLGFLYLFNPNIRKRDKICAAGLLTFINMSFAIRWLDYIWHGFHFTNMIPYRFSFLYSFVLLYMAYSAWVNRKHFKVWHIALATVSAIALMFCYEDITAEGFLAYNLGLLVLYIGVLATQCYTYKPKNAYAKAIATAQAKQKALMSWCTIIFLCIMVGEMVLNVITFGTTFPCTANPQMPVGPNDTSDVIEYMYEREGENSFFRTECTDGKTLNDGALYGYNGITAFTSSANVNVTRFMVALGFSGKDTYNRYSYGESSPVSNLFLNLKYMIERDGNMKENPYFYDVFNSGNAHLLENNAYLPLGFLTEPGFENFDISKYKDSDYAYTGNPFQFQNEFLSAATGINKPVWSSLEMLEIYPPASGPNVTPSISNRFSCSYDNSQNENSSHIVYKFTADTAGLVCMYIERSEENDYSFWHSGYTEYLSVSNYSLPIMSSVCAVKPGDEVSVWLNVAEGETGNATVYAAVLDEEIFREHYAALADDTLNITKFSNTNIEGTISCDRKQLLYTSIPQNGNWTALVDGEIAETVTIGNAMVGIMLTEGEHNVQLIYTNKSLIVGAVVTLTSTMALIGAAVIFYIPKRMRKKEQ